MYTIFGPKPFITKLWRTEEYNYDCSFRLMKYVLRVDFDDKVLLQNVLTGQLIVVDQTEKSDLDLLPKKYDPKLQPFINDYFLVPTDYDEFSQVVKIRKVLKILKDSCTPRRITSYTVLPTTACNARCYYCFEQGLKTKTMTEQTADAVVDFITRNCEGNKVQIRWFGGEPTVATDRIDRICKGLHHNCVRFSSRITTNGYLFTEEMIAHSKSEWNLEYVMISLDGVESRYNTIKSYINPSENPYQRVMRNISYFLKAGIKVSLRMNFDKSNYQDFELLLNELESRFGKNPLLQFNAHQINPDNNDSKNTEILNDEAWFENKIFELNSMAREKGLFGQNTILPCLNYSGCEAANDDAVTILPDGQFVRCPEQLTDDQVIGDLKQGIKNNALIGMWKIFEDNGKCHDCPLFPACAKVEQCFGSHRCFYRKEKTARYKAAMCYHYNNYHII